MTTIDFIASIVGSSTATAVIMYFLNKSKTKAEIDKLTKESKKTDAEARKIGIEIKAAEISTAEQVNEFYRTELQKVLEEMQELKKEFEMLKKELKKKDRAQIKAVAERCTDAKCLSRQTKTPRKK